MPLRPRRAYVLSQGLWEMQIAVPYPKAIRCGEMVFTCGQCDLDEHGRPLRPDDLYAQTDQTMAYAYQVLSEAGAAPHDLARLQVFYATDGSVDEDAYRAHLGAIAKSAGTCGAVVAMTPLPHFYYPGMAVEIDAVAVIGAERGIASGSAGGTPAPFASSRRAGETIFIAAEPRDPRGTVLHPGDLAAQTAALLDAIEAQLASHGADLRDLVKLSCYYDASESTWQTLAATRAQRFPAPGPVVTDVPLRNLSPAGVRLRIEAMAMRGTDGARLPMVHANPAGHWTWPLAQPFAQAIRCRDKIFIGAQLPLDPKGHAVAPDKVETQTERAMASLGALLAQFGCGFAEVVKANTYYVGRPNPDDLHRNMAVRNRYYRKPGPASTGVPVESLSVPGTSVAIEAFAMTA